MKKESLFKNKIIIDKSETKEIKNFIDSNILKMDSSYVIHDTCGYYYKKYSKILKENGYKIKVLDFINFDSKNSNSYNPFSYILNDYDVKTLVNCLHDRHTFKLSKYDQHFDKSEKLLLITCIYYIIEFCNDSKKNFLGLIEELFSVDENSQDSSLKLESLFENLPEDSLTYKNYKLFKQTVDKYYEHIIITTSILLYYNHVPEVANLTKKDDLEIEKIGYEKTALFIITPENDRTFSFLTSILYSQLFSFIKNQIDFGRINKQLMVPIVCIMDDFANIDFMENFPDYLSYMNFYNMSCLVTIQDLDWFKSIYKENWDIIVSNCALVNLDKKNKMKGCRRHGKLRRN